MVPGGRNSLRLVVRPICYDKNSHQLRTVKKFSWCHNLSFKYSAFSFKLALRDLPKFYPLEKYAARTQVLHPQDRTAGSSRTCGIFHLDLPGTTFISLLLLRIFSHHSASLHALHDLCLLVHHFFALCIQLLLFSVYFRYEFIDCPRMLLVTFRHVCTTCFLVLSSMSGSCTFLRMSVSIKILLMLRLHILYP